MYVCMYVCMCVVLYVLVTCAQAESLPCIYIYIYMCIYIYIYVYVQGYPYIQTMCSFTKHEYAEISGKPARIRMWIDRTRSKYQTCIWLKLLVTVLKVCMVAERASQGHAPAHLQAFTCSQPPLRASIGAMLPSMGLEAFTPSYVQNLDEREREQTMMILGMVAAARAMW